MKMLLKLIITKALICEVYNCSLQELMYTLLNMTLVNVKVEMKNHIEVQEASVIM